MGLDMYLYAEKYVGGWKHSADEEKAKFAAILDAVGMGDLSTPDSPGLEVRVTVAYWRKANAIHGWFVQKCQGGTDDCRTAYVEREALEELRDACKSAIERRDTEALPPVGGFFFGSTDVDEYYWQDLEDTVSQLDRVLKLTADRPLDLYYHSSW